jgi:hypothetical protein
VKTVAADNIIILLYACSAANTFASRIAGGVGSNCEVYAHTTSGHSFKNPYVKRFPPGDWVIAPGDRQWSKWAQRLRQTSLWAVFPYLTDEQLREVLDMDVGRVESFLGIQRVTARLRERGRRSHHPVH